MPASHRYLSLRLESLESRITPSGLPLSLPLASLPVLSGPVAQETPTAPPSLLGDLHLPLLSSTGTSGNTPLLGSLLGSTLGSLSSIVTNVDTSLTSLLGSTLKGVSSIGGNLLNTPVLTPLLGGALHEVHLPVSTQVESVEHPTVQPSSQPSLPSASVLQPVPASLAVLSTATQAPPLVPPNFVDPTLLLVSRQATPNPVASLLVVAEEEVRPTNLPGSTAEDLAWANASGGHDDLHDFVGLLGMARETVPGTTVTWQESSTLEQSFGLREGQLIEDFGVAFQAEPLTSATTEDITPAETTTDNAITLWLVGVLASCAGSSAYLSRRKERDEPDLAIDPRLVPMG